MNRKLLLAGLMSLCVASSAAAFAACSPEAPEAKEGTIYQTGVETFWVGVGKAYMTFENVDSEAVFHVNVDAGDGYSSWLSGSWEMEESGPLTLTAEWDASSENATYLAEAESGVPKEYGLEDGVYTIGVVLPSAGTVNFSLDPVADKVGEEEKPEEPCTQHTDEDGDGKCDNCGETMPKEPDDEEKQVQLTLLSEANAAGQIARVLLYSDNTWEFSICFYANTYNHMAGGTWSIRSDYSAIDLAVTEDEADVLDGDLVISLDASDPSDIGYSLSFTCNVPQVGELSFELAKADEGTAEPQPEPEPEPEPEPSEGVLYQTGVVSFWGGVGSAYITFEEGNAFNVNVNAGGGYSSWLTGTWSMEGDTLTLTAEWAEGDTSTSLADAVSGQSKTYALTEKAYTISVNLPSAGTIDFVLDMDEDSVTYTVRYMTNYGDNEVYETAQIKGNPAAAYIAAAPAEPTREGYHFAGWQTKQTITQADIVNGVSKYLWLFGEKLSETGKAKFSQMSEQDKAARGISEEVMLLDPAAENGVVTLYARWVEKKEISDAQGLKDIGKDLYGAYKLTADIALDDAWEPVGAYFSNYEYYNTEWWTYAFRGTLDGNGKKISGLEIVTAELNKNYSSAHSVWHDDGVTCNGTAAMFSALAGAELSSFTLESPSVRVTYSGDYLYAGALAAFDMTSSLTDIKVTDCDMQVTFDESALTFRDNLFMAVGGLEAGGWTNVVSGCEVTGTLAVFAANKISHGGEIYLGGLLGENYSTMTGCKADVELSLEYSDEGTEAQDSEIVINVGGLSGSGTSISGCTVSMQADVSAVKTSGASSVNVGGIVGSQRYLTTSENTVEGSITTSGCSLDPNEGALNVGGVGGRIDVYYMLQILAYTPVANAGAEKNVQNVTVNGTVTDKVIADAVSAIPGCWYIAKGDQLGGAAPSNIEEVVEEYGSYLPVDRLQSGIIYIVNSPLTAE